MAEKAAQTLLFGGGRSPRVAVIGGGFAGIAAGVYLKRAKIETFTIFEKSAGAGGTWWENRYPGAEVDTESLLYSFSFKLHDWTRNFAKQPELEAYLHDTVDQFGLRAHFRFGAAVKAAVWAEASQSYTLQFADDRTEVFDVVISAVGLLNTPRYPNWPGLKDFRGEKFHTSQWRSDVELAGRRVAVVGTGSSGAQIVANIAPRVGHLYVFQREPASVMPKNARDYTPKERAVLQLPMVRRFNRLRLFLRYEHQPAARRRGSRLNQKVRQAILDHVNTVFADRPDLCEALTPRYAVYGKRVVLDDNYFPAFLRDNVTLVPRAVERVTQTGVVDTDGVERPVDVLIMATGYQPANFLASLEVVGRGGRTIHETWGDTPEAFLGITVSGFPNFFMMYGPNTNGMVAIYNLECQAAYAVRAVKWMMRRGFASLEVRKSFMDWHNRWLQRRVALVPAWTESNNYYKSPSGRVVTQWPAGALRYGIMTRFLMKVSSIARKPGEPKLGRDMP